MTLLDLLRWILLALAVLAAWLVIGVLVALAVWHPFAQIGRASCRERV